MIRLLPLLLVLGACSPEQITASQKENARVNQSWRDLGAMCVRSGETYRSCDHMCYNAVHDRNQFNLCIEGARNVLAAKAKENGQ